MFHLYQVRSIFSAIVRAKYRCIDVTLIYLCYSKSAFATKINYQTMRRGAKIFSFYKKISQQKVHEDIRTSQQRWQALLHCVCVIHYVRNTLV